MELINGFVNGKNEIYKKICEWNRQYICEISLRNIIYYLYRISKYNDLEVI